MDKENCETYRYGVVVLNYKDYMLTISCVNKLKSLGCGLKIVVVDNNSNNDSFTRLSEAFLGDTMVTVLKSNMNRGYAAGNNIGLKYLVRNHRGISYLCVMNPDVEVEDALVFDCLKRSLENDAYLAAVSPIMLLNGKADKAQCGWRIPNKYEVVKNHFVLGKKKVRGVRFHKHGVCRCEAIPGSFFMIKKKVLVKIDYLDEGTFLYNEENIMGIKIKRLGMYCGVCVECNYLHLHKVDGSDRTLMSVLKMYKYGNQSRLYMCKKYYSIGVFLMVAAVSAINYPIIIIRHFMGRVKRWTK